MNVKLHGYFLLTGETVPLEDPLKSDVERQFTRAVSHLGPGTVDILALVAEVISRYEGIEKHCRITTHLNGDRGPTVDGRGATIREAITRALDRLLHTLCEPIRRECAGSRRCG
jgi:hypothetical protein